MLGLIGALPANRFFGVHTEAALSTEETFRVANKVAGPTSVGAGLLLAVAGVIALAANLWVGIVAAIVAVVVALFTLGAGAGAANEAIAGLVPEQVGGCGSACGSCSLRDTCQPAG
ncbi:MAG: SdpI family protein [Nocardia sp.]|nr:SdpI family protein [Nocardia sp.]